MPLPYFYRLVCCVIMLAATACGGGEEASGDGSGEKVQWPMSLVDTDWVYGYSSFGQEKEARLHFYKEGEAIRAKYNVGLYGELYDYQCEMLPNGHVKCSQIGDIHVVKNIFASMVSQGKDCDATIIKSKVPHTPDSVIEEGLKEAKAEWEDLSKNKKKYKKQWNEYNSRYKSGSTPLYYELFIYRTGSSDTSLNVLDHHFLFFNGAWVGPRTEEVGNTDFQRAPASEQLFWEDCESWSLLSRTDSTFPTSLDKEPAHCYWGDSCTFSPEDMVHYGFFPFKGEGIEAQDGCTYSMDFAVDARVVAEGKIAATATLGKKSVVNWTTAHPAGEIGTHTVSMVRKTSCPGKEDEKQTTCTRIEVR